MIRFKWDMIVLTKNSIGCNVFVVLPVFAVGILCCHQGRRHVGLLLCGLVRFPATLCVSTPRSCVPENVSTTDILIPIYLRTCSVSLRQLEREFSELYRYPLQFRGSSRNGQAFQVREFPQRFTPFREDIPN